MPAVRSLRLGPRISSECRRRLRPCSAGSGFCSHAAAADPTSADSAFAGAKLDGASACNSAEELLATDSLATALDAFVMSPMSAGAMGSGRHFWVV